MQTCTIVAVITLRSFNGCAFENGVQTSQQQQKQKKIPLNKMKLAMEVEQRYGT